jgi:Cu(I)/Ag(I) efflux system protein CusF
MIRPVVLVALTVVLAAIPACGDQKPAAPASAAAPTDAKATPDKGAKQFPAVGVITKIDTKLNSIELEHEKIEGLMPAMKMEWYVKDKALMNGIKVGDKVDFTVEEGGGRQYIVAIKPRS